MLEFIILFHISLSLYYLHHRLHGCHHRQDRMFSFEGKPPEVKSTMTNERKMQEKYVHVHHVCCIPGSRRDETPLWCHHVSWLLQNCPLFKSISDSTSIRHNVDDLTRNTMLSIISKFSPSVLIFFLLCL
jgi:hypothetical protein